MVNLLEWLNKHPDLELSNDGFDSDQWQVYRVNGGRSDRIWTLMGEGSTAQEALQAAHDKIENAEIPSIVIRARRLYNEYIDRQDIHCNRFPSWDELDRETRNRWLAAAEKSFDVVN